MELHLPVETMEFYRHIRMRCKRQILWHFV